MRVKRNRKLRATFSTAGPCGWCRRWAEFRHCHHLQRGLMGGGKIDLSFNLIGLCWRCHQSLHQGGIPAPSQLLGRVARRERLSPRKIQDRLLLIRCASKDCVLCPFCMGFPRRCSNCKGAGIVTCLERQRQRAEALVEAARLLGLPLPEQS